MLDGCVFPFVPLHDSSPNRSNAVNRFRTILLLSFKPYIHTLCPLQQVDAIVVDMSDFDERIAFRPVTAEDGNIAPRLVNSDVPGYGRTTAWCIVKAEFRVGIEYLFRAVIIVLQCDLQWQAREEVAGCAVVLQSSGNGLFAHDDVDV